MLDRSAPILERQRFLSFRLCGQPFALPLQVVREVVPFCALGRPAACPPLLEGILNLAGDPVSVLRLDRLLTLREITPSASSRILIVTEPKGRIGLLVEEVTGIEEFEADALLAVPAADAFNGCVVAQFQAGGEAVSVLSQERLLVRREREVIFHFAALEQQRARLLSEAPR